jgi:magnesium and cobalt transporter
LLDPDDLSMLEGVLQVAEMQVRDVMIPRAQMVVIERDAEPEKFLPLVIDSAHSRFPVVGESRDEVVGILLAKDILHWCASGKEAFRMREHLRPAVFVPESKRLNVLLREFRASRNHLAIVVDEYGGVAGMVTIEDVLEQIVGEIEDEHDIEEEGLILRHSSVRHTVKGMTPIEDLNEFFATDFSDEEFDTAAGLVTRALGHVPKRGESVDLQGLRFKVLRADNRRVHLLQVNVLDRQASESTETQDDTEHNPTDR